MRKVFVALAVTLVTSCGSDPAPANKHVRVFAASDLAKAFEEVAKSFRIKTGIEPVLTFGSSGLIARQVKEGAPIDLYASANETFVDDVVADGKCDGATKRRYARGRIVIWAKAGGVAPPTKIEDLADPRFASIAIASPDHAPYGKAAKEALEKAGIWRTVEGRIKYGENVSQTLQYAQTGNVEVAIVALSLAIVTQGGTTIAVPPELHNPIDQALVACGSGASHANAKAFADYVASPEGRAIMMRYGFILPGESGP
jgi:molybdate transport system substrate-binding protein